MLDEFEKNARATFQSAESMAWGAVEKAASDSVASLFQTVCHRRYRGALEMCATRCKAPNGISFLRMINDFADGVMRLGIAEGPPYTYLGVHFSSNRYIRVTVNPSNTKNAAKMQLSGLCLMHALAQLQAAWKINHWPCKKHEPGDEVNDDTHEGLI